jgi:hypothetical protein
MSDLICCGALLSVDEVGGREMRTMLLSLEPGSRIWLSLDGEVIQFEREPDDPDGRSNRLYRAIGETAHLWLDRVRIASTAYVEELEIVARPQDESASGFGFYREIDRESRA